MEAAHVIPKKELSSWQKWEFGTFDQFKNRQKTDPQNLAPQAPEPVTVSEKQPLHIQEVAEQDAIALPTAEQIEQIYQQAREEGKTTGYKEGMEQARHATLTEIQHLQSLIGALEQELKQVDQTMAQDILALAMDLARKIITHALEIKPELILPVVEDALRQLPAVSQPVRLAVHPDDAVRIRSHLENHPGYPKWHIHEDMQIEPGGCRVESGGCEVDATLATRWQRTLSVLGQDQHWLA